MHSGHKVLPDVVTEAVPSSCLPQTSSSVLAVIVTQRPFCLSFLATRFNSVTRNQPQQVFLVVTLAWEVRLVRSGFPDFATTVTFVSLITVSSVKTDSWKPSIWPNTQRPSPCFLPLSSHKYNICLFPSLKSNSKLIEKIWKGNTQGKITITSDPPCLLESSIASGLSQVSFLPWFACL